MPTILTKIHKNAHTKGQHKADYKRKRHGTRKCRANNIISMRSRSSEETWLKKRRGQGDPNERKSLINEGREETTLGRQSSIMELKGKVGRGLLISGR